VKMRFASFAEGRLETCSLRCDVQEDKAKLGLKGELEQRISGGNKGALLTL
jgi:hypothetical protein